MPKVNTKFEELVPLDMSHTWCFAKIRGRPLSSVTAVDHLLLLWHGESTLPKMKRALISLLDALFKLINYIWGNKYSMLDIYAICWNEFRNFRDSAWTVT
mmetsp:Transcript_23919/g.40686  ORF Transcript_23919/g.40686 Transcript_23919/m.40686 type:complete len:100 (-) Transcript_23919:172-471(-)